MSHSQQVVILKCCWFFLLWFLLYPAWHSLAEISQKSRGHPVD
jgi:hypothetical protein